MAAIVTEVTYQELVSKINANQLQPEITYKIINYRTVHYMLDGTGGVLVDPNTSEKIINAAAVEPLLVKASSENTLYPEAYSEQYPHDIIHYDWNPNNWVHDLAFGDETDMVAGWKGTIYFRHDTLNDVSVGEDFRKVLNRRWKMNYPEYSLVGVYSINQKVQVTGDGAYMSLVADNTGNAVSDTTKWLKFIDYSITPYVCPKLIDAQDAADYIDVPLFYSQEANPEAQYNFEVKSVYIQLFKDGQDTLNITASILQNNVFALEPDYGWFQVCNFKAGTSFCWNTMLGFMSYYTFGSDCNNNIIGDNGGTNVFGSYCVGNIIHKNSNYNKFGDGFRGNTIGDGFQSNTVENRMSDNFIAANFQYNTIGNSFTYNTIGNSFTYNTIGNSFTYNTIRDNFRQNTNGTNFVNNDFSIATHVYGTYSCELVLTPNGSAKLKYVDDSGVQQIVDATS